MLILTSLVATFKTIRRVFRYRKYVMLAISIAISLAVAQLSLLLMLFWAMWGFQDFAGIFMPSSASFWLIKTYLINFLQFFEILLISALMGIYVSLIIFFKSRCAAARREREREAGIGAVGFGVGVAAPIATSSAIVGGCCGIPYIVLPLVGFAAPLFGAGLSIFGLDLSELFRIVGIMILVASIYWVGNKIRMGKIKLELRRSGLKYK